MRALVRIVGIALVGLGLLCLPSLGRSPASYTSGFATLADSGWFLPFACGLLLVGAILFAVSFLKSN
jgi:hypothetical protein